MATLTNDELKRQKHREYMRVYRAQNLEKTRESARKAMQRWREENREIDTARSREWRANNPEKSRNSAKKYVAAHQEERKAYMKEYIPIWRAKNRERYSENMKKWQRANPEKVQAYARINNARRRLAAQDTDIDSQFLIQLRIATVICKLCDTKLDETQVHLDHIVPIALGGLHRRDNVRYICGSCNLKRPRKCLSL